MHFRISWYSLAAFTVFATTGARELRTPLAALHAPLYYEYPTPNTDRLWNFTLLASGYHRHADRAFTNNHGSATTNYAALYFGKEDFLGKEAFFDASVAVPTNPWLNLATMSARVTYHEQGMVFMASMQRSFCDDTVIAGLRARLPLRNLLIERYKKCGPFHGDLGAATTEDFVTYKPEQFSDSRGTTRDVISYAYRLDFLSQLIFNGSANPTIPVVIYQDPLFANRISMAGRRVVDQGNNPINYPIFVIKRADGSVPTGTFGEFQSNLMLQGLGRVPTALSADGTNLAQNQRGFFSRATAYGPLQTDAATQKTLWVVPAIEQQAASINISPEADNLRQTVTDLLDVIDGSAEEFFARHNICFTDYRAQGIGDLALEFFYHTEHTCDLWGEYSIGVEVPTARRVVDTQDVFAQPLGNNGHLAIRGSAQLLWDVAPWCSIRAHGCYTWVRPRTEQVAAPFAGATVKKIGPPVAAHISWGHALAGIDTTFLQRDCEPYGITLGYQLYAKQRDKVRIALRETADFLGTTRQLAPDILAAHTQQWCHTIRTEFFVYHSMLECYAGWSQAVAGKNAPKESDWYLGASITF